MCANCSDPNQLYDATERLAGTPPAQIEGDWLTDTAGFTDNPVTVIVPTHPW